MPGFQPGYGSPILPTHIMVGKLYIQRKRDGSQIKKPSEEEVDLYFDHSGIAQAFQGTSMFAEMTNVRIDLISADGIRMSGVEDPVRNKLKLFYQEWWFIPYDNNAPNRRKI